MTTQARVVLFIFMGAGLLMSCGSSTTPAGPGTPSDVVLISITGNNGGSSFAPATATLKVGQSVAWRNDDSDTHRPILSDVFDTGRLAGGATSTATKLTTARTYEYKCTIHPGMTGTI